MTQKQLIGLILDHLIENFKASPESFDYKDRDSDPSIGMMQDIIVLFEPKVELNNDSKCIVADPNNSLGAIIVSYSSANDEIRCALLNRQINGIANIPYGTACDHYVIQKSRLVFFSMNYWKLTRLRRLIKYRNRQRENEKFLRKLCTVFPTILDKHLLK